MTLVCINSAKDFSEEAFRERIWDWCMVYCENIGFKYQTANDVIGALTCCAYEYGRRVSTGHELLVAKGLFKVSVRFYNEIVANYEQQKIVENGDVF